MQSLIGCFTTGAMVIEAFELGVSLGLDTGDAESSLATLAGNLASFDKALSDVQSRISGTQLASSGLGNLATPGASVTEMSEKAPIQIGNDGPDSVFEGDVAIANSEELGTGGFDAAPTVLQSDWQSASSAIFQSAEQTLPHVDPRPGEIVRNNATDAMFPAAGNEERTALAPPASSVSAASEGFSVYGEDSHEEPGSVGPSGDFDRWQGSIEFVTGALTGLGETLAKFPQSPDAVSTGWDVARTREPGNDDGNVEKSSDPLSSALSMRHDGQAGEATGSGGLFQNVAEFGRDEPVASAVNADDIARVSDTLPPAGSDVPGFMAEFSAARPGGVDGILQFLTSMLSPDVKPNGGESSGAGYGGIEIAPPPVAQPETSAQEPSRDRQNGEGSGELRRGDESGQRPLASGSGSGPDNEGGQERPIVVHTNIQIDGDVVARAVGERMVAWMNGPLAGTGGFDSRRSYTPTES